MLSKHNRLKKRKSFNYIYRRGKHFGNTELTLTFVYARGGTKVGFSVSKKIGNSVVRHRVTRKMRHAMRPIVSCVIPNHSLIFVAREGIEKLHVRDIEKSMRKLLARAGCLVSQDSVKGSSTPNLSKHDKGGANDTKN